jgi:thermitase
MSYPAAYPGVVAVAATDHYDNLASFSNFGPWIDVAAPGTNILSAYPSAGCGGAANCYNWMSGTSMASPIIAGAAALVMDKISGGSPEMSTNLRDDVIAAIRSNADHTGALGQNMLAWTQYGRLNIQAALSGGTTNNPPTVSVTSPADGVSFSSGDSISFDGSAFDTEDGDLTADLEWTSDLDGKIGTGGSFSAVLSDGTHTIIAEVTDSGGEGGSDSIAITVVSSSGGDFTLSAFAYKVRGAGVVELNWSGTTSADGDVDVYRDGSFVIKTANDGEFTDNSLGKGGGSATYQVCEVGTPTCSNTVSVSW